MAKTAKGQSLRKPQPLPPKKEEKAKDGETNELFVKCPECRGVFHRATRHYRADIEAASNMLELIKIYADWGWTPPPPDPTSGCGLLECPSCGAALAPSGRLLVVEKNA
jgi:hypothetical protein